MIHKQEITKYGGVALITGCLAAVIADILGIIVFEDHNPIRQTISQLAHGKYAYIQDIGLSLFGLGILVGGIGIYIRKRASTRSKWGAILLAIMGILIIILAEFNQFAGEPGTSIHMVIAVVISLLFLSCTFLLSKAFNKINDIWHNTSIGIGIAFLITCSGFLIISESYEGAYERGVVLLVLIWFCALGYQMIKYNKKLHSEINPEV